MTPRNGVDGPASDASLTAGRFFTRWEQTPDHQAAFLEGGREGDAFYRDRWSHDKVVRSTHGVNCTGSCSWKVYVKDGRPTTARAIRRGWAPVGTPDRAADKAAGSKQERTTR